MKAFLALSVFLSVFLVGCDRQPGSLSETDSTGTPTSATSGPARPADCKPLDTRPRETKYKPAFEGQTRTCGIQNSVAYEVTVVTKELNHPWSVEPLPDGGFLVTEKPGKMRIVSSTGNVGPAISGVPPVDDDGQGGLLDVALSPQFASDRTIFWSFTEPRGGENNGTSIARGVLSADGTRLEQVRVILHTQPSWTNALHFGSRLAFGQDGMLYVTMGERSDKETRVKAQDLGTHWGKTLRIQPDGRPAPGNPFLNRQGALPEIYSYGQRNIQASAFDAQGQFWTIEHGPRGGDELNRIEPGKNYGWPVITYGIEYAGPAIGEGIQQRAGMEQPVYYWDPVIAPSGAQFYSGNAFPQWRGSLFIGALREMRLVRLVIENGRVTGEEHLLVDRKQRVRDVRQGNDGLLYVVTDDGEMWKIAPK